MENQQRYIDAEMKLATLSGWEDISVSEREDGGSTLIGRANGSRSFEDLPRWTREWDRCAPMIAQHQLVVDADDHGQALSVEVTVHEMRNRAPFVEVYADHATKDDAIRLAIVRAVTAKLELEYEPGAPATSKSFGMGV